MKKLLIGTAVVASLSLSGLAARASCVDPRSPTQPTSSLNFEAGPMPSRGGQDAAEKIVGNTPDARITRSTNPPTLWRYGVPFLRPFLSLDLVRNANPKDPLTAASR